jgi:hypothetical protein
MVTDSPLNTQKGNQVRALIGGLILCAAAPACAADYAVITLHVDLDTSADVAWSKVGSYCDIGKWAKIPCELSSGTGGVGSVRKLLGGAIVEPLVGATSHSYTYSQTLGDSTDLDYHGTLAIQPTGAKTARVNYTLTYDEARVPAEKRAEKREELNKRFASAIQNIKAMAEGRPF